MVDKQIKRFGIQQQEMEMTSSIFDFYRLRSPCTRNRTGFLALKTANLSHAFHSFLFKVDNSTKVPTCIIKELCVCLFVFKAFLTEIKCK